MNDAHQPRLDAPQLRTLLLTDLCDSTELVEKLGDAHAAELFREHDHLVLVLQREWRGRLIDRSDGLLLLFERPIDGLGFALDYQQGLRDLGKARSLRLLARAGLHVGEVLTWRNSEEAVQIGAKPLEVEGLAKPMAARLMTLARPGQILLSAVAESLTHRAARELGARGEQLLWKSHGRWRFKGVPTAQEIYEVGEAGLTPLRAPKSSPKARRDLPLWRRPAALVAEVALVASIAVGTWFMTRPEPAIAFAERDWVVVGDMRNLTGDVRLDDSLKQAFRISLEQSRYVNVLSDLKVRDTVARMRLDADETAIDRIVGSDVALRSGASALILPSINEVGGRLQASVEVVDPETQRTVYAESVDGTGMRALLPMVDALVAKLRGRLGEQVASIGGTSMPLPEVTTANIDALRAYALAQKRYGAGDMAAARGLYIQARTLDEAFALAWLGELRSRQALGDDAGALAALERAKALGRRLAPREKLYLDAWVKEYEAPEQAADAWRQLADLYPDYEPALGNAANWLYIGNKFKEALEYANRASGKQYMLSAVNRDIAGRISLALGDYKVADRMFAEAISQGRKNSVRGRMAVAAASGDFASANSWLEKINTDDRHASIDATTMLLDQGRATDAVSRIQQAAGLAEKAGGFDAAMFQLLVAVSKWQAGEEREARLHAEQSHYKAIDALNGKRKIPAVDTAMLAFASGLVLMRLDRDFQGGDLDKALQHRAALMELPALRQMAAVFRAEQLRRDGHAGEAVALLTPYLDGNERFQTRVVIMKAMEQDGLNSAALEQAQWLAKHRGLAYAEIECGYCLQALNVVDSNEAARTLPRLRQKIALDKGGSGRSVASGSP